MTFATIDLADGDPASDLPNWWKRGACNGTDPDLFYPEGGTASRSAKVICAICVVRPSCLNYAIDNSEEWGVWGGMTYAERKAEIRRRRRHP